jgi:hypothetical protein
MGGFNVFDLESARAVIDAGEDLATAVHDEFPRARDRRAPTADSRGADPRRRRLRDDPLEAHLIATPIDYSDRLPRRRRVKLAMAHSSGKPSTGFGSPLQRAIHRRRHSGCNRGFLSCWRAFSEVAPAWTTRRPCLKCVRFAVSLLPTGPEPCTEHARRRLRMSGREPLRPNDSTSPKHRRGVETMRCGF